MERKEEMETLTLSIVTMYIARKLPEFHGALELILC